MPGQSDQFYGYSKPYIPGSAGVSDTYSATNSTVPYQGTDWAGTNIEAMWEMVRKESDDRVFALAAVWRRASTLLDTTRTNLQRHAEALNGKWSSPAGRVFMQKVGASLYSLDEWKQVADDNATGLEQLGAKITQVQREMKVLFENYQAEQLKQAEKRADENVLEYINPFGDNPKSAEEVRDGAKDEAVALVKPLADMYMDVYFTKLSRGSVYQGPIDAAVVNPGEIPGQPNRPGAPGTPPGGPPGAPGAGGAPGRPATPGAGDAPAAPAPPPVTPPGVEPPAAPAAPPGPSDPSPAVPDGVDLAGGTAPAPPAPPVAPAPTPPGVSPGPAPTPPGAPIGPAGLGGRPGLPPTPPPGRPSLPNKASLPGAGSPTPPSRGPAPSKPTLPGARGPGGLPNGQGAPNSARRGTAPGAPRLPGSTGPSAGRPAAPRAGAPGAGRAPQAPNLGGNRGLTPGQPGARPSGSRPASPQLGGRGAAGAPGAARPGVPAPRPGTAKPDLTGRGAAPGSPKAPTTGPRPALGGRQVQPSVPAPRGSRRHDEDEAIEWTYDGDDELWATEPGVTGSVEAPSEHRPQHQGRSLGQA